MLRDEMIAELFLVVHDPEVIVVAGAEHAFRHYLIIAFSTLNYPDVASARPESITGYVS